MQDRDYTLKRMMSRRITPEEFQYESLWAPPLYTMLSREDIAQLHYYATSPLYSAKLKEKYKLIDDIMLSRGFKKLFAGTNRVAYEPTFANNFIIKVAYDKVALQDSINEFFNQHLLKPFCCKVFEVSECGTVGVFEKVQPITNSNEFISVAADIFVLLNNFLCGEFVVDDIGTHYMNNYGVRMGFGPVILDFPYVYRVDPKKIFCSKPDHNDPSGYCNGPIDYDAGFNKLYCKKCGCIYKPFELAKKIDYHEQVIKEREEIHMKIKISGGSKGIKKSIDTNDMQKPVTSVKTKKIKLGGGSKPAEEKKTVNGMAPAEEVEEEKVEAPVEQEVIEMPEVETKEEEKEKEVISAVSFDEDIKGKNEDPGYDDENVETLLAKINNIYNYTDKTDEEKAEIVNCICNMLESILLDNIEVSIKMFSAILRKKKNLKDDIVKLFLEDNSCSINNQFIKLLMSSGIYRFVTKIDIAKDTADENLVLSVVPGIQKKETEKIVFEGEPVENLFNILEIERILLDEDKVEDETTDSESEYEEDLDDENYEDDYEDVTGLDLANAEIISKKDVFSNEKPGKILVVKNDDGSYLTLDDKILAVDHISGRKLDEITIVPKDWYDKLSKIAEDIEASESTGESSEEE